MRVVSILVFVALSGPISAQFRQGDVFVISGKFSEEDCRAEASPPWGRLYFISDTIFLFSTCSNISVSREDLLLKEILSGKYEVRKDSLFLTDISPASYDLLDDSLRQYVTPQELALINETKIPDIRFKIDSCAHRNVRLTNQEYQYGSWERHDNSIQRVEENWHIDRVLMHYKPE